MARSLPPAAEYLSRSFLQAKFSGEGRYSYGIDIELGSRPPVPHCTNHEEPRDGQSQNHLTCGPSTPKVAESHSTISHSPKNVGLVEVVSPLDLLATEPWEKVTTFPEFFPSPVIRSLASSRSEVELRMPPKPTLLRNSKSLEDVPHFSLD